MSPHNRVKIQIPILILCLFWFVTASHAGQFKVTRVTDGDTIKVTDNGSKIKIRLAGIDAPETSKKKHEAGQPFSRKSTQYLASLVLNKSVAVKSYVTDRYGRTLGVVFVNGNNVNLAMIEAGLAEVYRGRPAKGYNPQPYKIAEQEARRNKRGI